MKKTDNVKTLLRMGALLAVAVTWPNLAQAQTCSATWTGNAGDGAWSTADNWSPREVPGPTSNVCIPTGTAGTSGTPSISVDSIQVGQSAMLVFASGTTVSIATSLTIQEGYVSLLGTTLSATSVDVQSGELVGHGTIEGSLTNNSYVAPVAGSLTVTGNYTQTSSGELSEQFGEATLNVNLNATLSGFLVVQIDFKRPPKSGATYTAMTFGSLSGEFTEVSPNTVTVKYNKNSIVAKYQ